MIAADPNLRRRQDLRPTGSIYLRWAPSSLRAHGMDYCDCCGWRGVGSSIGEGYSKNLWTWDFQGGAARPPAENVCCGPRGDAKSSDVARVINSRPARCESRASVCSVSMDPY
ncbi:unnamed protein product [Ascophyllum nodosum]